MRLFLLYTTAAGEKMAVREMLYIFDMGGVVTTTAAIENRICSILGISEAEFFRFCGCTGGNESYGRPAEKSSYNPDSLDLLTLCSDGIITAKEFWRIFSARSGIAVQTDWWHWLFHPVRNEETCRLIEELKACGNRVVCGTNTIDSHYMNHMERGDYAVFDQTYASCVMGVSKPNAEFWRIILTAENEAPENTVFIDDRKTNCDAAAALGIRALRFETALKLRGMLGL